MSNVVGNPLRDNEIVAWLEAANEWLGNKETRPGHKT